MTPTEQLFIQQVKNELRRVRAENAKLQTKLAEETALRVKYEASLFRP